jgi:hypothetical protein
MCAGLASGKRPDLPDVVCGQPREDTASSEVGGRPRGEFAVGRHDTITEHVSLRPVSTVLLRIAVPAFQAACRGFDPRLPLQSSSSCSGRQAAWSRRSFGRACQAAARAPAYRLPGQEPVKSLAM